MKSLCRFRSVSRALLAFLIALELLLGANQEIPEGDAPPASRQPAAPAAPGSLPRAAQTPCELCEEGVEVLLRAAPLACAAIARGSCQVAFPSRTGLAHGCRALLYSACGIGVYPLTSLPPRWACIRAGLCAAP